MGKAQYSHKFATRGVVSALDPLLLDEQSLARLTNGRLHKQLPRTRYKFREVALAGNTDLIDEWRALPVQGAMFFNPAKGQGALTFGKDLAQIVEASGGRKFSLAIAGRGSSTKARLEERTEGITHNPYVHLSWWTQAENYALTCDGESQLWVWDGRNPATASAGLNDVDKEESQLPNACTVLLYVHYRIAAVTDARRIYVGDGLHKSNLSSSSNLLQATETVYWNTGQWFSPPSGMGNIIAAGVLPLRNTQHGHSEAVFHCEDGVFSVQTNIPRDQWSTSAITRHMLLKTGAVGPYALDLMDGDQVFRSRHGIQTLRSAAAETNNVLNPLAPISGPVEDMFAGDAPQYLRFTSLVNVPTFRRLFCTVYPMVALRNRWSRGFISLNSNPTDVIPTDGMRSWEGIWTLPPAWGGIVQFIAGIFAGEERVFALCWNQETGTKTLIEVTQMEGDDELADGTRSRISCQLWSRAINSGDIFKESEFTEGVLFLKDVKGTLDFGVWYRANGEGNWKYWTKGQVTVDDVAEPLEGKGGRDFRVPIGGVPQQVSESRHFQVMIRWRGIASVETFEIQAGPPRPNDSTDVRPSCLVQDGTLAMTYSDFEYTSSTRWEETEYDPGHAN